MRADWYIFGKIRLLQPRPFETMCLSFFLDEMFDPHVFRTLCSCCFPLRPVTNKTITSMTMIFICILDLNGKYLIYSRHFMRLERDICTDEKSPNILLKSLHVGFSPCQGHFPLSVKRFVTSYVSSIVYVILRHLLHSRKLAKTEHQAINDEIVNIQKLHSYPNYPQKEKMPIKFIC